MKKLPICLALLSVIFTFASAQADVTITCDIGTIRISGGDLTLKDGRLSTKGHLYVNLRGSNANQAMMGEKNSKANMLDIAWDGNGNILNTKFGNIILSPVKDTPRVDIQFPDIGFYDGNKLINPDGPLKQQGCIQQ